MKIKKYILIALLSGLGFVQLKGFTIDEFEQANLEQKKEIVQKEFGKNATLEDKGNGIYHIVTPKDRGYLWNGYTQLKIQRGQSLVGAPGASSNIVSVSYCRRPTGLGFGAATLGAIGALGTCALIYSGNNSENIIDGMQKAITATPNVITESVQFTGLSE